MVVNDKVSRYVNAKQLASHGRFTDALVGHVMIALVGRCQKAFPAFAHVDVERREDVCSRQTHQEQSLDVRSGDGAGVETVFCALWLCTVCIAADVIYEMFGAQASAHPTA